VCNGAQHHRSPSSFMQFLSVVRQSVTTATLVCCVVSILCPSDPSHHFVLRCSHAVSTIRFLLFRFPTFTQERLLTNWFAIHTGMNRKLDLGSLGESAEPIAINRLGSGSNLSSDHRQQPAMAQGWRDSRCVPVASFVSNSSIHKFPPKLNSIVW
jgi:hypothetical protein